MPAKTNLQLRGLMAASVATGPYLQDHSQLWRDSVVNETGV